VLSRELVIVEQDGSNASNLMERISHP